MYDRAVAKLPPRLRVLAAGFTGALALCLAGCASWGKHPDSVEVCERGFAKDPDWSRDTWPGFRARLLVRQYPDFEFEGRTSRPLKPSTLWFRNDVSRERASCSMHSCDTGRCVWRIRLYAKAEDQWRIRAQYDLGKPHTPKVTGR